MSSFERTMLILVSAGAAFAGAIAGGAFMSKMTEDYLHPEVASVHRTQDRYEEEELRGVEPTTTTSSTLVDVTDYDDAEALK